MACYGLVKSMLGRGIEVFLVLPAKTIVCFHLINPEDADLLQPIYLSKENQKKCKEKKFKNVEERLGFLGMSRDYNVYAESEDETVKKIKQYSIISR